MKKQLYKAAIYLRLSKGDDDLSSLEKAESNSITNQRLITMSYIENHPEIVCKDDSICARINGKEYSLELISAAILKKAKEIAEAYFDEEINEAIVTVPAYFGIS